MKLIRPVSSAVLVAFFAFVCFVLLPHTAQASLQREGIVAVVNDSVVSYSDMRNRIRLNVAGFQGQMTAEIQQQIEKQSLEALINETLQMQEAARLDVSVSQQQINEGIDHIAQNNGVDPQEFRARLKAAGVNLSTLEDQVRAEIAWSYVVQRKLRPQINISETEIDATFQRIEHQKSRHQYRIAEIVLKGAEEETLNGMIKEVVDHLQKGAPFPAVAQHYSKSATSSRGGDLGWMDEQQLPAEYRDAVINLQKGRLAPPLQVDGGVAIVLLIDKYDADKDDTRVAASAVAAAQVDDVGTGTAADEMRVTLKQIVIPVADDEPEAVIVAKTARARQLSQEISGCAAMAEKSKHFLAPATGDIGTVSLSALPPQVAAMVAELPVGQVSEPIRHRDGIGVLMVCAREGTAKTAQAANPPLTAQPEAPLVEKKDEAMRDEVANRLGMERLNRLQEHYLRDLRAAAYIELRTQ